MKKFLALLLILASISCQAGEDPRVVMVKKARFEDVRDALELAITGRGLVVSNVAHIGDMLERTGKDLGDERRIYLKAESLEFCSALYSRRMMEADPDNIAFCPYVIAVYVLPDKPDEVRVAYRKPTGAGPSSAKAISEVEGLLAGIVKEALQ